MASQIKDSCRGDGTSPQRLRDTERMVPETPSLQLAASAARTTPAHPCQAAIYQSGPASIGKATKVARITVKGQNCRRDWRHHLCRLDTGEDQPLSSLYARRRRVHQATAHVLLAPAENLHGTTRARPATTSADAFLSVQPSAPPAHHTNASQLQAQAAEVEGAAVDQAPKYPEEERGDSTDPHADAQLSAVNDGRRSFSERADLRWQEVHEHSRADWRGCRRDWRHHLYRLDTGEDQPRYSLGDRRRSVHQAIAHVLLAPAETLHGTTRARAATTSAGAFRSVQPSAPSVVRSMSSQLPAQAAWITGAAVQQPPKSPVHEDEDNAWLHAAAQLFAVSDKLRSIYECTEFRGEEAGEERRAGQCCLIRKAVANVAATGASITCPLEESPPPPTWI
ncbi:uncharacterized protein LOC144124205 [Amblyomma americanum]